jgi:hypothetical protein
MKPDAPIEYRGPFAPIATSVPGLRICELLPTAKARSPWHRERFRDVDGATFTEADLPSLPTMSKTDLMDNFDAVVTDARLT